MLPRLIGLCLVFAGPVFGAGHPLDIPPPLQVALEAVRNGHYRQTLEAIPSLEAGFPGHPFPPLLAAEAAWGLIFCQTSHINSREIWNVADTKSSRFDDRFFQAVEQAMAASGALRRRPETAALAAFYDGLAHAVRTRLYLLREQAMKAGAEGKQMRASLREAVAKDPSLAADADAGLGVYNYYADVLSPLIKLFRFFLLLPGGDREKGLEQLRVASDQAVLVAPEARYELAKILALRENRPADALPLFHSLSDQYPDNAIYSLSAAIQAERIGKKNIARDYAQRAVLASRQMDDVCRARLEGASAQALGRLQGN